MPWHSLEILGRFPAFPAVWERHAGSHYQALKILCLQASAIEAASYPCPKHCGCSHRIIRQHGQTGAIGACRCTPPTCPDFPLTIEQITPLQLDAAKLGRALCKALLLTNKTADFPFVLTSQIGSRPSDAAPVILTIQKDPDRLRNVTSELSLRLQTPYILLAPTSHYLNANTQELLAHAKAAFFPLDTIVILTDQGTLRAVTPANDLFAAFSPSATPHSFARRSQAEAAALHIPHSHRSTTPSLHHSTPRFALRKGLGVWHLIFDGKETDIRHERGIFYVVWLLYNPPEHPIHALDLAAKIPEIYRQQLGLPALVDPATGRAAPLESGARIQERSLALDDAQAMRAIYKKKNELEAILDDKDASEPIKAEALRELEQICQFEHQHGARSKDSAQNVADTVRAAIRRFHSRLAHALDTNGNPHPVLSPFALHIQNHLLLPSARYANRATGAGKIGFPGCLTYEPPPGIVWSP